MISAATVGAGGVIVLGTWQAITATTARAPATARWWESLSLNDIRVSTSAPPPFGGFALSTVRRVSGQSLAGPLPSSGDPGHGFVGQRSWLSEACETQYLPGEWTCANSDTSLPSPRSCTSLERLVA